MLAAKVPCHYMAKDMKTFYQITFVDFGILLCVVISLFLPTFWEGISSRDFRPNATNAGILIFIFAVLLRLGYRWPVKVLVLSIIPVLVLTLLCIAYFSGYTGSDLFDKFNVEWFVYLNLFMGLPWLAGIAVASIALNRKNNS